MLSLSKVLSNFNDIVYFTLSEVGIYTCEENGTNPRFKEFQYSNEPKYQNFIRELEPYKKEEFYSYEWLLRPRVSHDHENEYSYHILLYFLNEITREILVRYMPNIIMCDNDGNLMPIPQDLCFFLKSGDMVLGSLSHEEITILNIENPQEIAFVSEYDFALCDKQIAVPKIT